MKDVKLQSITELQVFPENHAFLITLKEDFKKDNIEQDLTRLVGETKITQSLTLLEQKAAMEAASCLINYLEALNKEKVFFNVCV